MPVLSSPKIHLKFTSLRFNDLILKFQDFLKIQNEKIFFNIFEKTTYGFSLFCSWKHLGKVFRITVSLHFDMLDKLLIDNSSMSYRSRAKTEVITWKILHFFTICGILRFFLRMWDFCCLIQNLLEEAWALLLGNTNFIKGILLLPYS